MTKLKKTYCILSLIFAIAVFVAVLFASQNRTTVYAASMDPDSIDSLDNTAANTSTGSGSESDSKGGLSISINNDEAGVASEVRALLLLTIIAVSPSLLIMLTSYTRIVIVLHFLRTAIGTQTAPPNQILIGLALFLTFFIMWPTFQQINENAIQPLDNGDITIEKALKEASLTPVALMEKILDALKILERLSVVGSRLAISDVGAGVQLCKAALNGASLNVFINTKLMKDTETAEELNTRTDALLIEGNELADRIYEEVVDAIR